MEDFFIHLNFSSLMWQIITPLIFSVCDIFTGYLQALINKNVNSSKMREGLIHKMLLIIAMSLSFVISFAFNISYISIGVCIYICLMEISSILENIKKAGIDFKLLEFLERREDK